MAVAIAIVIAILIAANDIWSQVFRTVAAGIWTTVFVTVVGFALASLIGLGFALMALSGSALLRQISRFYVEIIRGVPIIVLLFWIAFAGVPAFVAAWNWAVTPLRDAGLAGELLVRDVSLLWRAVLALTIGYSAFIAEVSAPASRRSIRARSRPRRPWGLAATAASATSSFRRRSAPSCRRSATTSWPW